LPSRRELALVVSGFSLLTLALTYPQIRLLSSHIPDHYDALFTIWRLSWIAHQLPRDPLNLFDANIFHPAQATLAYSDAILLPGLLAAPFLWLGVHPVLVHNVLTLLSFVAAGVAMYVLARSLTGSQSSGWIAGTIFAFQSYRFAHFFHFELLWSCWIPLTFWAMHRAIETRRVRDGALVGLFVALQALSSVYYAIFLATALGLLLLVLLVGRRRAQLRTLVKPAIAGAIICVALAGPYAAPYLESRRTVGTRTARDIREWSPTLRDYVATPPQNWLYGRMTGLDDDEGTLFPGLVATVLAIAGIVAGGRHRLAYAVLLLIAFDMSLGFNGLTYRAFFDVLWPYQGLRVPARMFVIVSAALAALAAYGVVSLERQWFRARRILAVALTVAIVLESVSIPVPLRRLPSVPKVYAWLAQQPPTVIMEWPMPRASALGFTHEPEYMYYSTLHWHRLVNGYSGFYPPDYIRFVEGVRNFPDAEAVGHIRRGGIRYVILHSEFAPKRYAAVRSALAWHPDFELLVAAREGEHEVAVFQIRPPRSGA
jgi:hypothetical protein